MNIILFVIIYTITKMSNQDVDKFRVDVSSFNGFNHQEYTSGIFALALSDPKTFFKTRAAVVSVIKKKILEDFL